jgi:hypothetical protein
MTNFLRSCPSTPDSLCIRLKRDTPSGGCRELKLRLMQKLQLIATSRFEKSAILLLFLPA